MAASGAAAITGVPAAGLPKSTRVVSRNCNPASRASALWSITANSFMPLAAMRSVRRATVPATGCGLSLVTTPVSVQGLFVVIVSISFCWILGGHGETLTALAGVVALAGAAHAARSRG